MIDSFTVISSTDEETFWLLWKEVGYHNGNDYIHLSKILHYEVDEIEHDNEDGEQWINVGFLDQEERLILIFGINPQEDTDLFLQWVNWQMFRDKHETEFRINDEKILQDRKTLAAIYDCGVEVVWKSDSK